MSATAIDIDAMLADDMGRLAADPLGWVMYAFPWDSEPSIQVAKLDEDRAARYGCTYGPDQWACDALEEWGAHIRGQGFDGTVPVEPYLQAVTSGHGIGKSVYVAWVILFIMSTRPYCKGVVTANTSDQLKTKTWSELAKWYKLCITRDWFVYSNSRGNMHIRHVDHPENWRCDAQTCREENSESFAGLHAVNSTPFYIYDEASAVPNSIWEVSEGGMTDGEPFWFVFGNPTRTTGRFAECFGAMRHRWTTRQVDSRNVQVTNKAKIDEWREDYGEDSDFFRVRVRGMFPRVGDTQFIGSDVVTAAMARNLEPMVFAHFQKMVGVDVARFGSDNSVVLRRQGPKVWDPRSFNRIDTMQLAAHVFDEARDFGTTLAFVDGVGVGGGVVDRLRELGLNVIDVQSGEAAVESKRFENRRMEIWYRMREWLDGDVSLPAGHMQLHNDLTAPEYGFTAAMKMALEPVKSMRQRGLASPDYASALAMTFADFAVGQGRSKARNVRKVKWA